MILYDILIHWDGGYMVWAAWMDVTTNQCSCIRWTACALATSSPEAGGAWQKTSLCFQLNSHHKSCGGLHFCPARFRHNCISGTLDISRNWHQNHSCSIRYWNLGSLARCSSNLWFPSWVQVLAFCFVAAGAGSSASRGSRIKGFCKTTREPRSGLGAAQEAWKRPATNKLPQVLRALHYVILVILYCTILHYIIFYYILLHYIGLFRFFRRNQQTPVYASVAGLKAAILVLKSMATCARRLVHPCVNSSSVGRPGARKKHVHKFNMSATGAL